VLSRQIANWEFIPRGSPRFDFAYSLIVVVGAEHYDVARQVQVIPAAL